ncbi:triose-phosphate isomerase [Candidatus Micrarchaeota archaeon]|nr:triose-phosphate isomerase [Candidatus Micrarchaeota archaeon]
MKHVIALNLKTYEESTGEKGIALCRIAEDVSKSTGVPVIVAPQTVFLAQAVSKLSIPVFAQHVDTVKQGANTGCTTWEAVKSIGCKGSLINHSEHRLPFFQIFEAVEKAKQMGLQSLVCTTNAMESKAVSVSSPSLIAVEPPELIGSGISVSTAKPEIVSNTVKAVESVSRVPVLCGAGITTAIDVKKSIELGASGVLLASAFTKAKNPKEKLEELASGVP